MTKLGRFKRSYFLGRALWLGGVECRRRMQILYDLLGTCGVFESEVIQMTPEQFMAVVSKGASREILSQYQVFLVRGFGGMSSRDWIRFSAALDLYRHLRFDLGIRVVLLVDENVSKSRDFLELSKKLLQHLITDISDLIPIQEERNPGDQVSVKGEG